MTQADANVSENKSNPELMHHITLIIGLVCVGIGQTLLYTILGPASREIGLTEFSVGMIVTIAALVITLCSGMWGKLIRIFGSRNSYLAGMIFYTIGTLILALVLKISLSHYLSITAAFLSLLFVRCLTGALTAGIHPSAMTYIAESTNRKERGAGMALIASAYGIGSIIGPLLGSSLGSFSLLLPIYVAAVISFIGTILGFFVLSKDKVESVSASVEEKKTIRINDERVFPVFVGIALTYIAFSSFQQTISFYIQDLFSLDPARAVAKTGITISIMAVAMVFTQLVYIQIFKPSAKALLVFGSSACMLGFLGMILPYHYSMVINISSGLLGVGFGMMIPSIQSAASLAVSNDEQSGVAGFLFGASAFGYVLGPAMGTYLYSLSSSYLFYFAITSIVLATYFTAKVIYKK